MPIVRIYVDKMMDMLYNKAKPKVGEIYMKICRQCNQSVDDELEICPFCGSVEIEPADETVDENDENEQDIAESSTDFTAPSHAAPQRKSKLGLYTALALLAAAALAAILLIYFFKVVPSSPVTSMYKSQYAGDMDTYFSYIYPPNAESAKSDFNSSYSSAEDYKKELDESFKNAFGDDYKINVRTIDVESVDIDHASKILSGMTEDQLSHISDVATVIVKVKIEGSENTNITSATHIALKYDGKWYTYK